MTTENQPDSNLYALERTHMAAERTYFAVLRTGLAIASAGTVVVTILGESWPEWLKILMAGVFIAVGYTMIIVTLNNYQKIVNSLQIERKLNVMSPRLTIFLTAIIQVALVVVLALFLLGFRSQAQAL
jgi:uncharacterized membrane protein YidH (DUF202 family)